MLKKLLELLLFQLINHYNKLKVKSHILVNLHIKDAKSKNELKSIPITVEPKNDSKNFTLDLTTKDLPKWLEIKPATVGSDDDSKHELAAIIEINWNLYHEEKIKLLEYAVPFSINGSDGTKDDGNIFIKMTNDKDKTKSTF